MVLRIKNFNIFGAHWKIGLLTGCSRKINIEGGRLPKRAGLGLFANLRGGLGKKEGVVFLRGVLRPKCTLWTTSLSNVIDRNVNNGCIFCYNIGMPPPTLGERLGVHVCVWVYVCVLALCVYVCSWFKWGEVIAHPPVCPLFSHSGLFYLFFQNKVLLIPEKW